MKISRIFTNKKSARGLCPLLAMLSLLSLGAPHNACGAESPASAPYRDAALPIPARVADLVGRMTLEEKVAQMDMFVGSDVLRDGKLVPSLLDEVVSGKGIGAIHYLYPSPELGNEFQRAVMSRSRLGIPALVSEEMLHGYAGSGSTTFPVPLALASSFDRDLANRVGRAIASEARAHGAHLNFGPVLDLCYDPRYGRIAETFGEDTYLTTELGLAQILGLQQGGDLSRADAVAVMPKHFIGHGNSSGGYHIGPVMMGERQLRTQFLPPFTAAVRQAGVAGIMSAYVEIDGVPATGNRWLLTDVLRGELGFKGFVQSDWSSWGMLVNGHHTSADSEGALIEGLEAGVDMQFYDFPHKEFQDGVLRAVRNGRISEKRIDDAVSRILGVKFALGLFDTPSVSTNAETIRALRKAHAELALEAARSSVVLLQNRNAVLPLDRTKIRRLAVVGPLADRFIGGGYGPMDASGATLAEAFSTLLGDATQIRCVPGCGVVDLGTVIPEGTLIGPDGATPGLRAEYFGNPELAGAPVKTSTDRVVDFRWRQGGMAAENVETNPFSVRWTGFIKTQEDFDGWIGAVCNTGFKLWIDEKPVVEKWGSGTPMFRAPVRLERGRLHAVRLEYRCLWGDANLSLRWGAGASDFSEVVQAAKAADAVIVALGEDDTVVGENKDRTDLSLPPVQLELLAAVRATGRPVIVVLQNGRPLVTAPLVRDADALIEAWYPGQEGARVLAEIVFGIVNPSGRLAVSFPRNVGQLPINYAGKPTASHSYLDAEQSPQFPFGFGLAYTSYEYGAVTVSPASVGPEQDHVIVRFPVTNSGSVAGTETAQVYVHQRVSSVTTPTRRLCGFARVTLQPGERKTVELRIPISDFAVWNRSMRHVTEAGDYEFIVGPDSASAGQRAAFKITAPDRLVP